MRRWEHLSGWQPRDSFAVGSLAERMFDRIKVYYRRHMLGMLLVGVLFYLLQQR
jgi:hypothetical protein